MSYREFRTRRAWIEENWNLPSRSDNYCMQIALEVARAANPKRKLSLKDFLLRFSKEGETKKVTESQAEAVKQGWLTALMGRKKRDGKRNRT